MKKILTFGLSVIGISTIPILFVTSCSTNDTIRISAFPKIDSKKIDALINNNKDTLISNFNSNWKNYYYFENISNDGSTTIPNANQFLTFGIEEKQIESIIINSIDIEKREINFSSKLYNKTPGFSYVFDNGSNIVENKIIKF